MRPGIRAEEWGKCILCFSGTGGGTPDPFRKEREQLLLLCTRQRLHSSFDFGQRAHAKTLIAARSLSKTKFGRLLIT